MSSQSLPVGAWMPAPCPLPPSKCGEEKHYILDDQPFHHSLVVRVKEVGVKKLKFEVVRFYQRIENHLAEANPCDDIGNRRAEQIYNLYQSGKVKYLPGRLTLEEIEKAPYGWVLYTGMKSGFQHKTYETTHSNILDPFTAGNEKEFLSAIEKNLPKIEPQPLIPAEEFTGGRIHQDLDA